MRLFSFLVLEVLLAPVTLMSVCLASLWAIAVSRSRQLSFTALSPLFCRWLLHLRGDRPDPVAHVLMNTLESLSPGLNWGCVGPTLLAINLSGYSPAWLSLPAPGQDTLANMIVARTVFFDRALVRALEQAAPVEQVVILGAGFDSRLFKFCLGKELALFEVDQASTQQVKMQTLQQSGVSLQEINFVAVNFNQESWLESLILAGYDPAKKTFFLWEGVTYYLREEVVRECLGTIAQATPAGSQIAFDVFSEEFAQGLGDWGWLKPALWFLSAIGESFEFGVTAANGSAAHGSAAHESAAHRSAAHRSAAHRSAAHRSAAHRSAAHRSAAHRSMETELRSLLHSSGWHLRQLQLMGSLDPTRAFGGLVLAER